MLNNPYMAADVDAETTPRRLGGRKTWLTVAVGAISLATLVYLLVFYSVMISLQSRGLMNQMDAIMSKPPVTTSVPRHFLRLAGQLGRGDGSGACYDDRWWPSSGKQTPGTQTFSERSINPPIDDMS